MAQICGKAFPFGPRIASDEHSERLAALAELTEWLRAQEALTELDAQKIWYVLRSGLWKTDMVLVQHDFCKRLAVLVRELPPALVPPFVEAFFTGTAKEWGTIDKWRIEKFMVLVRYLFAEVLAWVRSRSDYAFLERLLAAVLSLEVGIGLVLHFIDVAAEPLLALVREAPRENARFLKPFCASFVNSNTKTSVALRIHDRFIEPIVSSDGEFVFGNDVDGALHFLRGLLDITNKALKSQTEANQDVLRKRFEVAAGLRASIKAILEAKKALGEPDAKQT